MAVLHLGPWLFWFGIAGNFLLAAVLIFLLSALMGKPSPGEDGPRNPGPKGTAATVLILKPWQVCFTFFATLIVATAIMVLVPALYPQPLPGLPERSLQAPNPEGPVPWVP